MTLTSGSTIRQGAGGLLKAATVLLTAPSGIGAAGNALALQVGALTANSSGANGNQFLSETGTAQLAGTIALNAGSGIIDLSGGVFKLSGNNQVNAGSTLQVDAGVLGVSTYSDTVVQLIVNGGTVSGTTGVLTSTAAIDGRSGSVSAVLAGMNGLTKTTSGTLTLSGADLYTGPTTISGGTLQVDGALAVGSAVTVQSGGTLDGTGTVNGTLSAEPGGVIAPGHGAGILTSGGLTLSSGSTFRVTVNGSTTAGADYSQLSISGAISLNGATLSTAGTISLIGAGDQIVLIKNNSDSSVAGTFNGLPEGATATINGVSMTISYVGGAGHDVVLTAVQRKIAFSSLPQTVTTSTFSGTITVQVEDAKGNPIAESGDTISLSSTSGTGEFFAAGTTSPPISTVTTSSSGAASFVCYDSTAGAPTLTATDTNPTLTIPAATQQETVNAPASNSPLGLVPTGAGYRCADLELAPHRGRVVLPLPGGRHNGAGGRQRPQRPRRLVHAGRGPDAGAQLYLVHRLGRRQRRQRPHRLERPDGFHARPPGPANSDWAQRNHRRRRPHHDRYFQLEP